MAQIYNHGDTARIMNKLKTVALRRVAVVNAFSGLPGLESIGSFHDS
jgi:hypothetical protein